MPFTQTMTIRTKDVDGLRSLMEGWHNEQHGVAPGYQGSRLLVDRSDNARVVIEVDFSSVEEAQRNNDRAETQQWADKLRAVANGEPDYQDFDVAFTTG